MGLSMASKFVIGLLSLVLVAVLALVVWGSLGDDILYTNQAGEVNNEVTFANNTGDLLAGYSATHASIPVIVSATNRSDNAPIVNLAGNLSINGTGYLKNVTAAYAWNNISINYTYTYDIRSGSGYITDNATKGTTDFFVNVPTWLVLIGVVIIILIISAVIVVINRFSGGNDSM